jgi:hypothetical protein
VELTPTEIAEIQLVAECLDPKEVAETLQGFLDRERALFERMEYNAETKKAMLYGISCLVAAIAKLDPNSDQKDSSEQETPVG